MKSSCSFLGNPGTEDCKAVEQLNMTLQTEMPVFGWKKNVTYRNIACARCNNEQDVTFWGLNIKCVGLTLSSNESDINAVRAFMKGKKCSWKYVPPSQLNQSCVLHDTKCASNNLPVMSVVKELCSSYSMTFKVNYVSTSTTYRNPHCALCDPVGLSEQVTGEGSIFPPWSIILDVSGNFRNPKEPKTPQPNGAATQGYNITSGMFNCTSNISHCTVTVGGKTCQVFIPMKNQSTQMNVSLDKNPVMTSTKRFFQKKIAMKLESNTVYALCPDDQDVQVHNQDFTVLIYITIIGTSLSVISLCFLLCIYLVFKQLRNLPGKCLINICLSLLCYQTIFLAVQKANEVDGLCKAVAILLHFFILAAFSWMSVMAFNTANAFTVKGESTITSNNRCSTRAGKI